MFCFWPRLNWCFCQGLKGGETKVKKISPLHLNHSFKINLLKNRIYWSAMVRKLKYHEQKLLRKVDFTTFPSDNNHRDAAVIRRYAIQQPGDYTKYNRLSGNLRQLAHKLAHLEPDDPVRRKLEDGMLEKLWTMGILGTGGGGKGKLSDVDMYCSRFMLEPVGSHLTDYVWQISMDIFGARNLGNTMTTSCEFLHSTLQFVCLCVVPLHFTKGNEKNSDLWHRMDDKVTWMSTSLEMDDVWWSSGFCSERA